LNHPNPTEEGDLAVALYAGLEWEPNRIGPSGLVIDLPVARIHRHRWVTLAGAGQALVRLRGLPEVRHEA
jgi:hypothetical protein